MKSKREPPLSLFLLPFTAQAAISRWELEDLGKRGAVGISEFVSEHELTRSPAEQNGVGRTEFWTTMLGHAYLSLELANLELALVGILTRNPTELIGVEERRC
ncbi:hypothetical protein RIF29_34217 [Crotalaria pallida]|uniref:Uncharacterized protein n=1 Tax=Crotalaria pallida TaxID=3830 RepID=A0AAN9E972_CROPI